MFNQESTLVTILNKAADMVILSVLWCICSLPVLTIGAASACPVPYLNPCPAAEPGICLCHLPGFL